MPYKVNLPVIQTFRVLDSLDTPVIGLVVGDFEIDIFHDGAIPAPFPVITFTEIGDGFYSISFTPQAIGWWALHVCDQFDASSIRLKENFKVLTTNTDDASIWSPVGIVPITVNVLDPSLNPVEGVSIAIWDATMTVVIGYAITDLNGVAGFTVAPGVYNLWPYKSMYDFSGIPVNFIAAAGVPQTFNLTANPRFIRKPVHAGHCIVWGYLADIRGRPIRNALVEALREDASILSPTGEGIGNKIISTSTNYEGYFEMELVQTELVTVRLPEHNLEKKFYVPAGSAIDFFSITVSSPP